MEFSIFQEFLTTQTGSQAEAFAQSFAQIEAAESWGSMSMIRWRRTPLATRRQSTAPRNGPSFTGAIDSEIARATGQKGDADSPPRRREPQPGTLAQDTVPTRPRAPPSSRRPAAASARGGSFDDLVGAVPLPVPPLHCASSKTCQTQLSLTSGLEEQHPSVPVFAEPIGQHAPGRSGADDDVIV